jgi:hypothetical protein
VSAGPKANLKLLDWIVPEEAQGTTTVLVIPGLTILRRLEVGSG